MNSHRSAKLVFGGGYLGLRVARKWLANRDPVYVVTRSSDRVQVLNSQGFRAIHADVTEASTLVDLPAVETVLFAVGFDRNSGKTIDEVYVDGLSQVISALPGSVARFIYISSTGVYGQSNDEWVDETSECRPERRGGKACLAAEQRIANDDHLRSRAIVLRLAGIYGPDRVPHYQDLMANRPIPTREGHINLIHVDDAVKVVLAVEQYTRLPCVFTVSDGLPVLRREFYHHWAQLAGAPEPRFETLDHARTTERRIAGSKRVSNRRMIQELSIQLDYPSYREGLAHVARMEKGLSK